MLGEVSLSWSKVFPIAKSRPVLRGVWGQSTDGFIGLSASGKVILLLIAPRVDKPIRFAASRGLTRVRSTRRLRATSSLERERDVRWRLASDSR